MENYLKRVMNEHMRRTAPKLLKQIKCVIVSDVSIYCVQQPIGDGQNNIRNIPHRRFFTLQISNSHRVDVGVGMIWRMEGGLELCRMSMGPCKAYWINTSLNIRPCHAETSETNE